MRNAPYILPFLIFFTVKSWLNAQNAAQDSAYCNKLKNAIMASLDKPAKALLYADTLKTFTKKNKLIGLHIDAQIIEPQVYMVKAEWDVVQKILQDAEQQRLNNLEFFKNDEGLRLESTLYSRQLLAASKTNDYKKLEKLIQKGMSLVSKKQKTNRDSNLIKYAHYYQHIIEKQRGNFTEALRYYNIYKKFPNNETQVGNILDYTQYAEIRLELKQQTQALQDFHKADSFASLGHLVKNNPLRDLNYKKLLSSRIQFYIRTKQFKQADSCLQLFKAQILRGSDKHNEILFTQLKGDYHAAQSQFEAAFVAYSSVLLMNKNIYHTVQSEQNGHNEIAKNYNNLAFIRFKQKRFSEAMTYINEGFKFLDPKFLPNGIWVNPMADRVIHKQELLKLLDCKAAILLDWSKQDPTRSTHYQSVAYRTAYDGIQLIESIRMGFSDDYDKRYLLELMYPLYEKGIEATYQLYAKDKNYEYLSRAFDIFERSKATTLLQAIRSGQAEEELSETDFYSLKNLHDKIAKLENDLHKELFDNQKDELDPSLTHVKQELDQLQQNLKALAKSFEQKYPNYFRLKYSRPYAALSDVQKRLPNDESTALFEYFVGNDAIYIFAISNKRVQLFKQNKPQNFEFLVNQFHQLLRMPKAGSSSDYAKMAHPFYALLWQPLLSIFPQKPQKVVVVADGLLCLLPFEGMLTQEPTNALSYRRLPYLIREHKLLYAYSANSYLNQKTDVVNRPRYVFAGFAPQYPKDFPFPELPNSISEIEQLADLLNGKKFIGKRASEQVFKDNAHKYRILHLSMHSDMEDVNPMFTKLIFQPDVQNSEDNLLTTNEIYKLRFNADLVVLSACETGLGQLSNGEGTMSFARAFQYAGVPNTVMSLWVADDEASKNVMIQFYQNLKNGQSKEDAMRNAKLDYLNGAKTEDEAHPFFWLTFNIIGNESPINLTPPLSIWWVLLPTCAFCLIILVIRYQMRSKIL